MYWCMRVCVCTYSPVLVFCVSPSRTLGRRTRRHRWADRWTYKRSTIMCGRFASSSCGRHHGAGRHRCLTNDAATSAVAAAAVTGRQPRLPNRICRTPQRGSYHTPGVACIHRLSNMEAAVFRRTHYTRPVEDKHVGDYRFWRKTNDQQL